MHRKKVSIVSKCFAPQIRPRAFRTTELAKELSKRGLDVTVYLPEFDIEHDSYIQKYGINFKYYGPLKFKKINPDSNNGFINFLLRGIRRLLSQFVYYPDIELAYRVKKILEADDHYDLLISIANPHSIHWGVAWKRGETKTSSVWIADCGDPFMGQSMESFNYPFYFESIERRFCKSVDYLAVPEEESIKAYYSEFHDKIKVIPQGFDFSIAENLNSNYIKNDIPKFAYAGTFYKGKRNPQKLIKYLLSRNFDFKFILYTNSDELISPLLSDNEKRIEIRNFISRNKLLFELSKMDFLINLENSNTSSQIPSKLIDYHLTGRPVLTIDPKNIEKEKIDEFLKGNYRKKLALNDIYKYDINNVADEFMNLGELKSEL